MRSQPNRRDKGSPRTEAALEEIRRLFARYRMRPDERVADAQRRDSERPQRPGRSPLRRHRKT